MDIEELLAEWGKNGTVRLAAREYRVRLSVREAIESPYWRTCIRARPKSDSLPRLAKEEDDA